MNVTDTLHTLGYVARFAHQDLSEDRRGGQEDHRVGGMGSVVLD